MKSNIIYTLFLSSIFIVSLYFNQDNLIKTASAFPECNRFACQDSNCYWWLLGSVCAEYCSYEGTHTFYCRYIAPAECQVGGCLPPTNQSPIGTISSD